jgi:hypothetical protein
MIARRELIKDPREMLVMCVVSLPTFAPSPPRRM